MRTIPLLAIFVAFVACGSGAINSPITRYQGILLNAHDLGAGEVTRLAASDPTIRAWVAREGDPDFVLVANPKDVEFVYVQKSEVVHFHKPETGGASISGSASPLPSGVNSILPESIRAGTPEPLSVLGATCWTLIVGPDACRTCCRGPQACVSECRAGGPS
jgi:hypothetical protein